MGKQGRPRKTHCINGHPYSGTNVRLGPQDIRYRGKKTYRYVRRICQECAAINRAKYLDRMKKPSELP